MQAGALADGLQLIPGYPADNPEQGHYVALGSCNEKLGMPGNFDYHWWRLDDDTWSHKPGECSVKHTDEHGDQINADNSPSLPTVLAPYDTFGGYYFVPDGIDIK